MDLKSSCVGELAEFFELLRSKGLTVGVPEAVDAIKLIELGILKDRNAAEAALRCLMAKSEREQEVFSGCFEEFFTADDMRASHRQAELERRAEREEILDGLRYNGRPVELEGELTEVYATMDGERRERLNKYLGLSSDGARSSMFGYEFVRRILEQHLRMEQSLFAGGAGEGGAGESLLYRDISRIGEDEMPHAVSLIQGLVRRLNGSLSRRERRSGRNGRLDFRATIRSAEATGAFFRLRYRRRAHARKKLVLLCDVSGSMLKYSEFAIRFLKAMSDTSSLSRVFVFSEGTLEVPAKVLRDMDRFSSYIKGSGLWGKGTDIAAALGELTARRPAVLGRNSVLVVISDTRTVRLVEAAAAMQRAMRLTGSVIWLNPVPERVWPKMHSAAQFRAMCDMLDCSTIHELSRACARLMIK